MGYALVKSMGIDILALNETKLDHLIEQQLTEAIHHHYHHKFVYCWYTKVVIKN